MGRKEMEAVGMGCLFVDPLLQWFLISLRRNSNVNMTARLCTCVLYHCLHPLAPHTEPWVTSLLSVLCRAFFQLGVVLKDSHLSQSLVPLSSPSPGRDTLSPSLGELFNKYYTFPSLTLSVSPWGLRSHLSCSWQQLRRKPSVKVPNQKV